MKKKVQENKRANKRAKKKHTYMKLIKKVQRGVQIY